MASGVIGLLAGMGEWFGGLLSPPRGGNFPEPREGWVVVEAVVWVVAILTARGVGRLILRPWRQSSTYGYRLLGLSAILVCLLGAGQGLLSAAQDGGGWHKSGAGWPGPEWARPIEVLVAALVSQVAAVPWLIDKKRVVEIPGRQPLVVWVMLAVLFVTSAAAQGRRLAAALASAVGVASVVAAANSLSAGRPFVLVKPPGLPVRRTSDDQ
jgi:hypothetical protein